MKVTTSFTWWLHGYQRQDFHPGDELPEEHEAAGYAVVSGFVVPEGNDENAKRRMTRAEVFRRKAAG